MDGAPHLLGVARPVQEDVNRVRKDPVFLRAPRSTRVDRQNNWDLVEPDRIGVHTGFAVCQGVHVVVRLEQSPLREDKLLVIDIVEDDVPVMLV